MLRARWNSSRSSKYRRTMTVSSWDSKCRVHFSTPRYIELPEEDKTDGEDQVGVLLKTMHGTRDASAEWEGNYLEEQTKV